MSMIEIFYGSLDHKMPSPRTAKTNDPLRSGRILTTQPDAPRNRTSIFGGLAQTSKGGGARQPARELENWRS
jgi:hypothetical protein